MLIRSTLSIGGPAAASHLITKQFSGPPCGHHKTEWTYDLKRCVIFWHQTIKPNVIIKAATTVIPQRIMLETTSIKAERKVLSVPLYKKSDNLKHHFWSIIFGLIIPALPINLHSGNKKQYNADKNRIVAVTL